MHQNYLFSQRILLSPLGSSWVFKLHWKQQKRPGLSCWLSGKAIFALHRLDSSLMTWGCSWHHEACSSMEKAEETPGIITTAVPTNNISSSLHPAHSLASVFNWAHGFTRSDTPGGWHLLLDVSYTHRAKNKSGSTAFILNYFQLIPRHWREVLPSDLN